MTRSRSPPSAPLPRRRIRLPVSTPRGTATSSRLPSSSSSRLVPWKASSRPSSTTASLVTWPWAELDPLARRAGMPAVQVQPGQDVLEAGPADRPRALARRWPARPGSRRRRRLQRTSGEKSLEATPGVASPELVADAAGGRAGSPPRGRRAGWDRHWRRPPSWPRAGRISGRLSGSERTSLASLISLNFASAALSPGLMSGWCWRTQLLELVRLISTRAERGARPPASRSSH